MVKAIAFTLKIGTEFQDSLNTLQAVSGATDAKLVQVRATGRALGNDLTLPATSAKDAAEAMTELAKGGLSVDASMKAAKGTLQLAAAAQVSAAQAATIQSQALNAFALSGDKAGHVADVLANTANAASGEITDFALGMSQVSAVAHGFQIGIEDTSTALGLFANVGIKGSAAGTSLKTMLLALASPSKTAAKALETLNVQAFDQNGKFVGLRSITEQLTKAKAKLSQQDFLSAASTAFGTDATRAATAFAQEGTAGFDKMAAAVNRQGGAAEVAAAKTKGLGGAIEGFKSQIETIQIDAFTRAAPGLEALVRNVSNSLPKIADTVFSVVDQAAVAASTFGPVVGRALLRGGAELVDDARKLLSPFVTAAGALVTEAAPFVTKFASSLIGDARRLIAEITPVASAIGRALTSAGGPLHTVGGALSFVADGAGLAVTALGPLFSLVRSTADAFSNLPGPLQTVVIAIGAVALLRNPIGELGTRAATTAGAFQRLSQQMAVQRSLALSYGASLSTTGAAMATLQARVPVIGAMGSAFRSASINAAGLAGTLRGTLSAGAVGAGAALKGITGLLGGPFGIAMLAGTAALSYFAAKSQAAKDRQNELASAGKSVAQAISEQNGVINANVRAKAAQELADRGLLTSAERYGITSSQAVDAITSQGSALDQLRAKLKAYVDANTRQVAGPGGHMYDTYVNGAEGARKYGSEIDRLVGSTRKELAIQQAIATSTGTLTGPLQTLSGNLATLGDNASDSSSKVSALKSALDILAGGNLSLEAATKQLNDATRGLGESFKSAAAGAKDNNTQLLTSAGAINTATEAGSALFTTVQGLAEAQAQAAQSAFDLARSQGKDVPAASAAAQAAMTGSYNAFLKAAEGAGLTETAAKKLAERYGLLPSQVLTVVKLEGQDEAGRQIAVLQAQIKGVPVGKSVTITALTAEAVARLEAAGVKVHQLADGRYEVRVTANTNAAINEALNAVNQISALTASIRVTATAQQGAFRGATFNAEGAILKPFAAGGFHNLTPMRGGLASIVAPGTFRVIGDNLRVPEAYIPIEKSQRSVALLAETAARMDFALMRTYASGGINGAPMPSTPGSGISVRVISNTYLEGRLVDQRIEEHLGELSDQITYN